MVNMFVQLSYTIIQIHRLGMGKYEYRYTAKIGKLSRSQSAVHEPLCPVSDGVADSPPELFIAAHRQR
jgi:hypothetical protein